METPGRADSPLDVVCAGETMVMVSPVSRMSLLEPDVPLSLHVGGAESNVACGMAHFGYSVSWWSRVGNDPFGGRIVRELTERGVDASQVVVDERRPTGIYLKDPGPERTNVYYYRAGSAASAMSRTDVPLLPRPRRLLHVSGVTAAISPTAAGFLEALVHERALGSASVSFDVNFRPRLWGPEDAGPALRRLAEAADIAIVGRDEAEALWGTSTPEQIREQLSSAPVVVVKDAEVGATHFEGDRAVFEPSERVDPLESVGAGDAFAAGYLTGVLDGAEPEVSLRLGHLVAGFTLRQMGDLAHLPASSELRSAARRRTGSAALDGTRNRRDVREAEPAAERDTPWGMER
jgi:2-dehydro-3-deoxygluconokinase